MICSTMVDWIYLMRFSGHPVAFERMPHDGTRIRKLCQEAACAQHLGQPGPALGLYGAVGRQTAPEDGIRQILTLDGNAVVAVETLDEDPGPCSAPPAAITP